MKNENKYLVHLIGEKVDKEIGCKCEDQVNTLLSFAKKTSCYDEVNVYILSRQYKFNNTDIKTDSVEGTVLTYA